MLPTIEREADAVVMIDQRKLPAEEIYVRCTSAQEVAKAIKTMVIRGAAAIGVAAAMGIALGIRKSSATGTQKLAAEFYKICELMAGTRPTAVNLFWAIERMRKVMRENAQRPVETLVKLLEREALSIRDEDLEGNRRLGEHGAALLPKTCNVLTHCNAGGLATAGIGTALGIVCAARDAGKKIAVWADETRPVLQGAQIGRAHV